MIGLALLAGLATTQPSPATVGSHHSPKAVVEAMFAAFNRNDVEALAALYGDDARLTSSDFCAPRLGKDGVRRTYSTLFHSYPGIKDRIETMLVEGDKVAVRFTTRSVVPGKEFEFPLMTILTVRGGLIRSDDTIFNAGNPDCTPGNGQLN